jgi:hypothetical protein
MIHSLFSLSRSRVPVDYSVVFLLYYLIFLKTNIDLDSMSIYFIAEKNGY